MKLNTSKVYESNKKPTNKSLDNDIKLSDDSKNNILNTSNKSINSIKYKPAMIYRQNKSINDYILQTTG
jgi:hypothetical protein